MRLVNSGFRTGDDWDARFDAMRDGWRAPDYEPGELLVTTKPSTAEEYVSTFPTDVQQRLMLLRDMIHEAIPGASETIRYGMPAVMINGRYIVHYAAWKHHIGLYPVPALSAELEADVAPLRSTKDTMKLLHRTALPTELLRRILLELYAT